MMTVVEGCGVVGQGDWREAPEAANPLPGHSALEELHVNKVIKSSPGCPGVWDGGSIRLGMCFSTPMMLVGMGFSIPAGVFSAPFGIIISLVYTEYLFSFWNLGMFVHAGQRVPT